MAKRFQELQLKPRNVDEQAAGQIVGKIALFRRMVACEWIVPVVAKHSCVLYAEHQVQACCDLLQQGYYPGERDPDGAVIKAAVNGVYRSSYDSA